MASSVARENTGKKVMVAIEEHECSHHALEWALLNLKPSLSLSSPLLIITVQPLATFNYIAAASSYASPPPELIQSVQEHQKEAALGLLEKAKAICAKHGVYMSMSKLLIFSPSILYCFNSCAIFFFDKTIYISYSYQCHQCKVLIKKFF
jgi:hypothetical protein